MNTDGADRGTHLPQRPELPLFNAEELAEFPCDNGGMPGGVVQDRLPKGRAGAQCAYSDSILYQKQRWCST